MFVFTEPISSGRSASRAAPYTAPAAWTPEYFRKKYGADAKTPPKRGWDSVTVPGAVSAWATLSQRFGKLPFADLMQPAIEIAERGYLLPVVALITAVLGSIYSGIATATEAAAIGVVAVFAQIDPLPSPQAEPPVMDGDAHRTPDQD